LSSVASLSPIDLLQEFESSGDMENEFMKPYKKEVKQEEVMAQTEADE